MKKGNGKKGMQQTQKNVKSEEEKWGQEAKIKKGREMRKR